MAENREKPASKDRWWQGQLLSFGKLSGYVAGPVIAATVVGKWLDGKFGTEPFVFLLCVGTSLILSMIILVKKAGEEIDKNAKFKNQNEK